MDGRPVAIVLAVVLLLPSAVRAEEALFAVVDRIIAAYGGEAALSAVAGLRQTGRTISHRRGGAVARIVRVLEPPGRLRVEIAYPGEAPEIRVLDGDKGWSGGAKASSPMRAAMRLQAARLAFPFLLPAERDRLIDHGTRTGSDGIPVRVLELPIGRHMAVLVAADLETGRIVRSRGVLSMGGAEAMDFATAYYEFRTWDGILFAAREEQYAMGTYTGRTVIEEVQVLEEVPPGSFRP